MERTTTINTRYGTAEVSTHNSGFWAAINGRVIVDLVGDCRAEHALSESALRECVEYYAENAGEDLQ